MRGIYAAAYLEKLARDFANRHKVSEFDIGQAFDLIVGTSTGGIIACALAAGIQPSKVVNVYKEHGKRIFRKSVPKKITIGLVLDLLVRSANLEKGENELRKVLREIFEDMTLGKIYEDRKIALAITAIEMGRHQPWVFKTPHSRGTSCRDNDYKLTDVCLATTAAPILRSLAVVDYAHDSNNGFHVFADGGLWGNNPVLVGMIEALELAEPEQPIEIFCLDTCPLPAGEEIKRSDVYRGILKWKCGIDIVTLADNAQLFAFNHMAKKLAQHLKMSCTVVHFPSADVPEGLRQYLDPDNASDEAMNALINQAHANADKANSLYEERSTNREINCIYDLLEKSMDKSHLSNPGHKPTIN